jgi:nitrate/nitrite transporter NarK
VLAWFFLEDRVKNAQWLTLEERELIARDIAAEESGKADGGLASVLSNGKVWLLAFIYFAIVSGLYGVSFWLPSIIKAMGVADPLQVGFISVIPWAFGIVAMYLAAHSADYRQEYRWHTAVSCVAGAAGLLISVAFHADVMLSMAGLTICTMGIMSALPIFWSNPTAILGGTAAAMGIALINSVGNLAGFAIPWIIGLIKDATHSTDSGLHMLAALMVLGAIAVLLLKKPAVAA